MAESQEPRGSRQAPEGRPREARPSRRPFSFRGRRRARGERPDLGRGRARLAGCARGGSSSPGPLDREGHGAPRLPGLAPPPEALRPRRVAARVPARPRARAPGRPAPAATAPRELH